MVRVGVGVIIVNHEKKILIGKRLNTHAPYYSIAGGHLELGETFEAAAIREVREETSLEIEDPKVLAVTNNLETYSEFGKHSISVILLAEKFSGTVKNLEPQKCAGWEWVSPHQLPMPHFDASRQGIACYLQQRFYCA